MKHLSWLKGRFWDRQPSIANSFDLYIPSMPSLQNSIDSVPGWYTSFPPQFGLRAGSLATYNDPRIAWAIECYGSIEGRHVLEIGSFEAGHTSMLEAAGARVDAVEVDPVAFLRCLIAREIYGLTRAKFWLGDFMKSLENSEQRYDLIVACGIMHQLKNPLRFIELASKRTDALYLSNHPVAKNAVLARHQAFMKADEAQGLPDRGTLMHRRSYANNDSVTLSQDISAPSRQLEGNDLLEVLKAFAFTKLRTASEKFDHPSEPTMAIFARK
jgi:hypothetical protein